MSRCTDTPTAKKVTQLVSMKEHVERLRQAREAHRRELIDDYVEPIPDLIREVGEAHQADMVARLGASQPMVTKILRRLVAMGLVEMIPWRGTLLTTEREKLAQESRERHQIVGNFSLVLGVSPEIARRGAEGVEHYISEETLDAFRLPTQKHGARRAYLPYVRYRAIVFSGY